VPTYSGKSIRVPQRHVLPLLLLVGLIAAFVVGAPWSTLPAISLIYVASIPVSYLEFQRLARRAPRHIDSSKDAG